MKELSEFYEDESEEVKLNTANTRVELDGYLKYAQKRI